MLFLALRTDCSPESTQEEELQNKVAKVLHLVPTKYTTFHRASEMEGMLAHSKSVLLLPK